MSDRSETENANRNVNKDKSKGKTLNLPNRLTILRLILIPFFMFFIVFDILPEPWPRITAAVIFALTALTDMLDGMLARRLNMITDFGKFLDPLADKLMIFGAMLAIMVKNRADGLFTSIFVWPVFIVIFREVAVTSLRMIASNKGGEVIAAHLPGKIKTVTQMLCILTLLLEPVAFPGSGGLLSYIMIGLMTAATVWSGTNYFIAYWPYIGTDK